MYLFGKQLTVNLPSTCTYGEHCTESAYVWALCSRTDLRLSLLSIGWRYGYIWVLGRKIWTSLWVSVCTYTHIYLSEMNKEMYSYMDSAISPEFRFYGGTWPALVVTDHSMLQQILITKFKFFSDRIVSHNPYCARLIYFQNRSNTVYVLLSHFCWLCLPKDLPLLNTKLTGLPPGLFECRPKRWKHVRHITSPAFTNVKLRKVTPICQLCMHLLPTCVFLTRLIK